MGRPIQTVRLVFRGGVTVYAHAEFDEKWNGGEGHWVSPGDGVALGGYGGSAAEAVLARAAANAWGVVELCQAGEKTSAEKVVEARDKAAAVADKFFARLSQMHDAEAASAQPSPTVLLETEAMMRASSMIASLIRRGAT